MLIYYLLLFNVVNFPGDIFVNGLTMGTSEMIAMAVSGYALTKLPNLACFRLFLLAAFFGSISFNLIDNRFVVMFLILISVIGGGGAWNILYMVCEERMPTEIRVACLEIALSIARMFVSLAPYITRMPAPLPMTVLAGVCAGTFLVTFSITTPPKL